MDEERIARLAEVIQWQRLGHRAAWRQEALGGNLQLFGHHLQIVKELVQCHLTLAGLQQLVQPDGIGKKAILLLKLAGVTEEPRQIRTRLERLAKLP